MPDRRWEWRDLRMVYPVDTFAEVVEHERPDFLVRPHEDSEPFGVEITEVFLTEGHARLHRRTDYLPSLFAGGPLMHKDDAKYFSVVTVSIRDADGALKSENVPAVITEPVLASTHLGLLADAINGKAAKGYEHDGVTHIELVLYDDVVTAQQEDYSITDCFDEGVREAILNSNFHEIHWILRTPDGTHVVRAMRQMLLFEQFGLFAHALGTLDEGRFREPWMVVQLFVDFGRRIGLDVALSTADGRLFANHRGTSIGLEDDWATEILDHTFWAVSPPVTAPREGCAALTEDEWLTCEAFVASNSMNWGLHRAAEEEPFPRDGREADASE